MVSVFIPTYNPNIERLNHTVNGLKLQTLAYEYWQLIVVDNNSSHDFSKNIDISWHLNAQIVKEQKQGLTFARLKGIATSQFDIIVMVDDDNVLDIDYLQNVVNIFSANPKLGAIGGKSIPKFEAEPPIYIKDFYSLLALRDLGEETKIDFFENKYPKYAPIGAGMAFRKQAIENYVHKITSGSSVISDRKGNSLSSSGDNDMVYEIAKAGWQVGYFPQLSLQHIIATERLKSNYLAKLNFGIQKSWVQFLSSHYICPWQPIPYWSVPLRKLKAYFTYKAWESDPNYIKWRGACGMFEGLEKLKTA